MLLATFCLLLQATSCHPLPRKSYPLLWDWIWFWVGQLRSYRVWFLVKNFQLNFVSNENRF